jgi:integrase/recombinase XerD
MQHSLDSFRQDLALRGLSRSTIDRHCQSAGRYIIWAHEHGLEPEQGRKEDLLAYLSDLRARGLMASTLANNFISLSSYFSFLVECGQVQQNPIPAIQKRYLHNYKDEIRSRQLISIEDARKMVATTLDTRDKAILMVFLKTGIRRTELITLDLENIDLKAGTLTLKPTAKRSNRIVFFDEECRRVLARWLKARETRFKKDCEQALFISLKGTRLRGTGVDALVSLAAQRVGLHDCSSPKLEDRFTPHCCRHWFTTYLLRSGMKREYVQWLRGDAIKEAVDIYFHIAPEDAKESYLMHIPQLGL